MRRSLIFLAIFSILALPALFSRPPAAAQASNSSGNIQVETIPGPTVTQKLTDRAKSSWPWYVTRASGLIAALSLIILMLSGIGQVTGHTFRFLEPLTAWASHRALGLTFDIAVLIHMFSLLFDHFVQFSIWQILVPWLSDYRPVTIFGIPMGSFYVALGVLSFYLVGVVIITSLLWVDKKPHLWKWLHLLSYIIILFVFIHALYIGTDLAHGIFRWLWVVLAAAVAAFCARRLWGSETI